MTAHLLALEPGPMPGGADGFAPHAVSIRKAAAAMTGSRPHLLRDNPVLQAGRDL